MGLIKSFCTVLLILLSLSFWLPQSTFAQLGVGVGLGKIKLEEDLIPGGVYRLPSLPVVNTGKVETDFEVTVEVPLSDSKINPRPDFVRQWFRFSPQRFFLEPNQSEQVGISLSLPFTVPKGNYQVLLEAHPLSRAENGNVSIGPAAATKLTFSVGTAPGVLGAFRQRTTTLWHFYQPWSTIVALIVDFLAILFLLRNLVTVSISFRPRKKNPQQERLDL